jgi:hypothetical protein
VPDIAGLLHFEAMITRTPNLIPVLKALRVMMRRCGAGNISKKGNKYSVLYVQKSSLRLKL